MFEGRRKPKALVVIVVTLLAYGCPIQRSTMMFSPGRTVSRERREVL